MLFTRKEKEAFIVSFSARESRLSGVGFDPWEPALSGQIRAVRVGSQGLDLTRESRLSRVRFNPWESALMGRIWPVRVGSLGQYLTPESQAILYHLDQAVLTVFYGSSLMWIVLFPVFMTSLISWNSFRIEYICIAFLWCIYWKTWPWHKTQVKKIWNLINRESDTRGGGQTSEYGMWQLLMMSMTKIIEQAPTRYQPHGQDYAWKRKDFETKLAILGHTYLLKTQDKDKHLLPWLKFVAILLKSSPIFLRLANFFSLHLLPVVPLTHWVHDGLHDGQVGGHLLHLLPQDIPSWHPHVKLSRSLPGHLDG